MSATKDYATTHLTLAISEAKTSKDVYFAIREYVETRLHIEFDGSTGLNQTLNYRGSIVTLQIDDVVNGNIEISFSYNGTEIVIQLINEGGANFVRGGDRWPYYDDRAPFPDQVLRDVLGSVLDFLGNENIWIWSK